MALQVNVGLSSWHYKFVFDVFPGVNTLVLCARRQRTCEDVHHSLFNALLPRARYSVTTRHEA